MERMTLAELAARGGMLPNEIPLSSQTTATQSVMGRGKFIDAVFASKIAAIYTAGLYDTALTAAVASSTIAANQQLNYFTSGQNVAGSTSAVFNTGTKNACDTNLKGPGGIMAMNQTHISREFGAQVFMADISGNMSATTSYQQALLDFGMVLTSFAIFYVSGAINLTWGVIQDWPGGGGIGGAATGGVGPTSAVSFGWAGSNGHPTPMARNQLDYPVVFTGGEAFNLSVNNPQAVQQLLSLRWVVKLIFWGTFKDRV